MRSNDLEKDADDISFEMMIQRKHFFLENVKDGNFHCPGFQPPTVGLERSTETFCPSEGARTR